MSKTDVLFLPGMLCDANQFGRQATDLAELTKVEIADLSRSDSIAAMAADALGQVRSERFAIVGLSLGGYVALEIMRQAPQRVSALALLDTSARPDTPEATAKRQELMRRAEDDFPGVIETLIPLLSHPSMVDQPEVRGVIQSMAMSLGKDAFLRQERAIIGRPDSRPGLGRIGVPTLVLCGHDDQITPIAVHEELAAAIPGAVLEVVDECGHLSTLDQPARVSAALEAWLGRIGVKRDTAAALEAMV